VHLDVFIANQMRGEPGYHHHRAHYTKICIALTDRILIPWDEMQIL